MPPLHPGEPGDGHGDEGLDEDDVGFVPPLPPQDRLWRHPSEVGSQHGSAPAVPASATGPATGPPGPRLAAMLVLAGMVGASLALGAAALLGGFDDRVVERRVAASPASRTGPPTDAVTTVAARTAPAVAALHVHRDGAVTTASAVVLRSDGLLVTDAAAIDGADGVDVLLERGPAGSADVVGSDPATGIAVLRIDADDLEPARLGDSSDLALGARTVAVGAAGQGGWRPAVTTGVVSATGRRLQDPEGKVRYGMLLIDKPFVTGTVGGAVVDADGTVVAIASRSPGDPEHAGFGVATPIDLARHVSGQLIADGAVEHVWIGVHGTDLDPGDATATGLRGGALVEEVVDGGPAARAGVRSGDVVVAVDGEATPSMAALIAALQLRRPRDEVALRLHRDGEASTVHVVLGARPQDR